MAKWTKDQEKAIITRDKNLLVSAAAGSGKTAVLTERIIRLVLEEKISIDEMLIVTFTNAAASEMRERILAKLIDRLGEPGADSSFIRDQISIINKSYITTVHSFCIDIVRKNFFKLSIDPNFKIGDPAELNLTILEIIDQVFEDEYALNDPDFIELVESYGTNRDDAKLKDMVLRLYRFIQSKPNPLEWLRESASYYEVDEDQLDGNLWMTVLKKEVSDRLESLREIIDHNIRLCSFDYGPSEYMDAVKSDGFMIDCLIDSLNNSFDIFVESIGNVSYEKLKRISKKRDIPCDEKLADEVKSGRDDLKKALKKIQGSLSSKNSETILMQLKTMAPAMKYLAILVEKFMNAYQAEKLDKGILDFNDLEHYAIELLADKDISDKYRNRFKYIFLDEYQDSNIVQETIIGSIVRDNNLFLVGDVKQSIYKFRLADPSLFIDKYQRYSKDESARDYRIDLSKNFRSRREILDGINYLFKNLMSYDLGEIEYDEDAFLYTGTEFLDNYDPSIEVDIIDKSAHDDDIDDELKELETVELEAIAICRKIKDIIGKTTYDGKRKLERLIEYRDIVILLRATKSWSHIFSDVFMDEGIPLFTDSGNGFFDVLEIKIFVSLLRIIDNRFQDIPLLTVLRSPIGGFSIEELIEIRTSSSSADFSTGFFGYAGEGQLNDKIQNFIEKLARWTHESSYMKLDEFIWKLLTESGFYYYAGGLPSGSERQGNLRILVSKAKMFEESTVAGLFNFIKFIEKMEKTSGDMDTAKSVSESENVVKLMSIHKSKGLEFPVVILAGAGKRFNLMDLNSELLIDKDLGFGLRYVDHKSRYFMESLPQTAIKSRMRASVLSEELRILYVALTRAVDKLIVFGSINKLDGAIKKWQKNMTPYNLLSCNSYLEWIMTAIIRHPDLEEFRMVNAVDIDVNHDHLDTRWKLNVLDRGLFLKELNDEKLSLSNYKEFIIGKSGIESIKPSKDLVDKFNYRYAFGDGVNLPSKTTVTELKRLSSAEQLTAKLDIPMLKEMPSFIKSEMSISGAELGTGYHAVLQHMDYSVDRDRTIDNTIESLIRRGLLSSDVSELLDREKLNGFVDSNLFERIKSSQNVFREEPFVIKREISGETVLIQGIIDLYFFEGDEIVLVDYKSDKIVKPLPYYGKIYGEQLELYKEALEKISGVKVKESIIYFIDVNKEYKL